MRIHRTLVTLGILLSTAAMAHAASKDVSPLGTNYMYVLKWGSYGSAEGQFNKPRGIDVDAQGNLYVADQFNHRVQKFDSDGEFLGAWGSLGNGNGQFNESHDVVVDSTGNVYVADKKNARVQKFNSAGQYLLKWGTPGTGNSQFDIPADLAIGATDTVYVVEYGNNRVQKFTADGGYLSQWGSAGEENGQFWRPQGITTSSAYDVFVADYANNRMQKFDSGGEFFLTWGGQGSALGEFQAPYAVDLDSQDDVYVADMGNHRMQKFTSDGQFITSWGRYGTGNGEFRSPRGVVVDPEGNVYVAEMDNHRIQKFAPDADRDGLSDYSETLESTDPQDPDSDGDGYWDGCDPDTVEIAVSSTTHPDPAVEYAEDAVTVTLVPNDLGTTGYYWLVDQSSLTHLTPETEGATLLLAGKSQDISFTLPSDGQYFFHVLALDSGGQPISPTSVFPVARNTANEHMPIVSSSSHRLAGNESEQSSTDFFNIQTVELTWTNEGLFSDGLTYRYEWDHSRDTIPTAESAQPVPPDAQSLQIENVADGIWFFHIQSIDPLGYASVTYHFRVNVGNPLDIDRDGVPNSTDEDDDGDGLSNDDEAAAGTDPTNPDSDFDGITDGDSAPSNFDNDYLAGPDADPLTPTETLTVMLPGDVPLELVKIHAGTFMMGSPYYEYGRGGDEDQHQVTLTKDYWIGKYELTKGQWQAIMGSTPWVGGDNVLNDPDSPAIYVSRDDAGDFCVQLSALDLGTFRLPTEAEWEYACRAGTSTRYSFGNDPDYSLIGLYAWYENNAWDAGERYAHVVGLKRPNPWGLYDMHGNVHEWCLDWYAEYGGPEIQTDPQGPDSGDLRVMRGGSWHFGPNQHRSANRRPIGATAADTIRGFRIVREVGAPIARLSATPDTGTAPLEVQFADESLDGPTAWEWDFDSDGTVDSTEQNPVHTYAEAGYYTVTLTVTNADGSDTVVEEHLVAVVAPMDTMTVMLPGDVPLELVKIPAGTFMMGSPADEVGHADNEDLHEVTLTKDYWIGKYEFTKEQWTTVMGTAPWNGVEGVIGDGDSAAVRVNWNDAVALCTELNSLGEGSFRLPTEAEWERACRAGSFTRYCYGDDLDYAALGDYAWYAVNARDIGEAFAHQVGHKKPNVWGLFDMHGNAWEWCQDWYQANLGVGISVIDPQGPETGTQPVLRGGAYNYGPGHIRSAARDKHTLDYRAIDNGFRIVREVTGPGAAFSAAPTTGTAPLEVTFTDESAGGPTSWEWDFDSDGTVDSTEQNPSYTYITPGTYTVTLTVTNSEGSDAEVKTDYIVVDPPSYALTTSVTGEGSIVRDPAAQEYTVGTQVELTAQADEGWVFDHWEGDLTGNANPANITMDAAKSVTAVFVEAAQDTYTLTMEVEGTGTTIPAAGAHTYDAGAGVVVSAQAGVNWHFDHWEGDLAGSETPTAIVMNSNKTVRAVFSPGAAFDGTISGYVTNSITGKPLEGVLVEVFDQISKAIDAATTDAQGYYELTVPQDQGAITMLFSLREYFQGQQDFDKPPRTFSMALVPGGVTKPKRPTSISGPKSVFLDWTPNPEYNLKGYYIWRTHTDAAGTPLADPVKINQALLEPREKPQFVDATVQAGEYYIYQVQALSGGDRLSELSEASDPPTQGQFLTVFFPEIHIENTLEGLYLWDFTPEDTTDADWIRIPVSFRCAYEVSTSAMEIVAELPTNLVTVDDVSDVRVETTGITEGMTYTWGVPEPGTVKIISSETVGRDLYDSGALFDIYVKRTAVADCGELHLVEDTYDPDAQTGEEGVIIYSQWLEGEGLSKVFTLLEDGLLCTAGAACVHGDLNGDGAIDEADVAYLQNLYVGKQQHTDCTRWAGDFNLDKRVNSADACLLQRYLEGLPINPSDGGAKALYDRKAVSFAAHTKGVQRSYVFAEPLHGTPGTQQTVAIKVLLGDDPLPLAGFDLELAYPAGPSGVSFVSAVLGDALAGTATMEVASDVNGDYGEVVMTASQPVSLGAKASEVTIAEVTFLMGSQAPGDAAVPLQITLFDAVDQYGYAPRHGAPGEILLGLPGDIDADGIGDATEGDADPDGDGVPNYLDADSDGDGIPDADEAGENPAAPRDSDGDGVADYLDLDSDDDTLDDATERNAWSGTDVDGDGVPNHLDLDSDDDGAGDAEEAAAGSDPYDPSSTPMAVWPSTLFVLGMALVGLALLRQRRVHAN